MILLIVLAYGLVWLLIGGMVLAAAAALVPVLVLLFLFALLGAVIRPRGARR